MLKKLTFLLLLSVIASTAWAQLNMSVMSQLQYNVELNDIWGYAAPDGSEYALVGANNGVSIVDVSDPTNATEVAFIPGQSSRWRDIKTFGEFAYVVTDESGTTEGVTVIDLSDLPNSANATNWRPNLPGLGTVNRCHNIYIDEFGYVYLAGCNVNDGGMLILDVFSTPGAPDFVSAAPSTYSHDVFVRDNKMYASELYLGRMAIYDVTDKEDIVILGVQNTPLEFTHNIWVSDDGNTAYTTDERANAPVAAYDITDPTDITELDQYRPTITLGDGVIPHNVHVWEDWLIISYYTDGGIVVDAARPDNLVEVGNFDTFFGTSGDGFDGVWGAYPFLPSGIVLLSDIGSGLYVMDVDYVRACYLEGNVTDAETGAPINETEIIIDADEANINFSRLDGDYATGVATSGTYDVTFSKPGYEVLTTTATIENGVVTILDVELIPLPLYSKEGIVVVEGDGSPVADASIILDGGMLVYEFTGNDDGTFLIDNVFEGVYDIFVGSWGFRETLIEGVEINNNESLMLEVSKGYEDSFTSDYGWTTTAMASTGLWERAEPIGTYVNGSTVNPEFDLNSDFGDQCYVTGNGGGGWADDDIDGGAVVLTSPVMALASTYADPVVEYNLWFWNGGGSGNPNDDIEVEITNGTQTITIEVVDDSGSFWRNRSAITLSDFITITDEMQLIVTAGDYDPGHVTEAAIDAFSVTGDLLLVNTTTPFVEAVWKIAPNPSKDEFLVVYELAETPNNARLRVVNSLGQVMANYAVTSSSNSINLGHDWLPGVYFVYLEVDGQQTRMERLIKQ